MFVFLFIFVYLQLISCVFTSFDTKKLSQSPGVTGVKDCVMRLTQAEHESDVDDNMGLIRQCAE